MDYQTGNLWDDAAKDYYDLDGYTNRAGGLKRLFQCELSLDY